jgi:lysophospholipase L1-like esterase
LFRLKNGELPSSLQPKIFWILIGTNDASMGCSADVIVAGNIHILQHLQQHSTSKIPIVINSLLPRGSQPLSPRRPLWRIIHTANQQLACYAAQTPLVHFANITDRLIESHSDGTVVVHPDMFIKDKLHPSPNGSLVWEEFIVDLALSLLAGMK